MAKSQYQKEYQKNRSQLRKEQGLCVSCGLKSRDGKTLCEKCNEKQKVSREKSLQKKKKSGICTNCTEPSVVGKNLCKLCSKKKHSYCI